MQSKKAKTIAASTVVLTAAAAAMLFMAPSPDSTTATPTGADIIRMPGKLWDFGPAHPDMQVMPSGGLGVYSGLVLQTLGADSTPAYRGAGQLVLDEATDETGTPIAAFMANRGGGISDFIIQNGQVIVYEDFEALVVMLGVDVGTIPVTFAAVADGARFEPWGAENDPSTANVNPSHQSGTSGTVGAFPAVTLLPQVFPAGTTVGLSGTSWNQSSDWNVRLSADSSVSSPQVIVLRDGDPVPDIDPFGGQQSLAEYIADYVDESTDTIQLEPYQVIYLYELYTTDLDAPEADFQDMVLLLNLARPSATFSTAGEVLGCGPNNDSPATLSSALSSGGISGESSFNQWFHDVLGQNLSVPTGLDLRRQSDDTFLFDDQLDPDYAARGGFYPADVLKHAGNGGHNDYFTTTFQALFTYDSTMNPFVEVTSDADTWVFIDDQLVIDLGGIHAATTQRIDLSRLCLVDGTVHEIKVFRAQRSNGQSRFRVWANLLFHAATASAQTVSGQFD